MSKAACHFLNKWSGDYACARVTSPVATGTGACFHNAIWLPTLGLCTPVIFHVIKAVEESDTPPQNQVLPWSSNSQQPHHDEQKAGQYPKGLTQSGGSYRIRPGL